MKPLSESEFKEYVVKRAKEYIFGTTDSLQESSLNESITPQTVKQMVEDLKRVNASLTFNDSLIEEPSSINESEDRRSFQVGTYENSSIELKNTLSETMTNYNNKKSLTHGKEDQKKSWERLVEYRKYEED